MEQGGIEELSAVGVAGGEVVEFWMGRRVEKVALERQVVVRHAGFIVQKRIIYLVLTPSVRSRKGGTKEGGMSLSFEAWIGFINCIVPVMT